MVNKLLYIISKNKNKQKKNQLQFKLDFFDCWARGNFVIGLFAACDNSMCVEQH